MLLHAGHSGNQQDIARQNTHKASRVEGHGEVNYTTLPNITAKEIIGKVQRQGGIQ